MATTEPIKLRKSIPPPKPNWPENRPALAVSFSGGGFRASLAGIGMIRGLSDLNLLRDVRYTSSVSGGSWANAMLALNWDALKARDFSPEAVDDLVVTPFVERVTTSSLLGHMLKNFWRVLGPATRSDLLGNAFDDWFGNGATFGDLSDDARFIFNSTNLNSGRRFFFEQARAGDYKAKYVPGSSIRVADGLAASAAIPGMFTEQRMRAPNDIYPKDNRPYLVDGAAYDNLGLEAFGQLHARPLMVVLDAGAQFKQGILGTGGILRSVKQSSAVVRDQVTTVRRRWLIEGFRSWEDWEESDPQAYEAYTTDQIAMNKAIADYFKRKRKNTLLDGEVPPPMPPRNSKRGVTFGLDTSMYPKDGDIESTTSRHQRYEPDDVAHEVPPWRTNARAKDFREHAASVPMSGSKFDEELACDLVYRGWWLTRESLRTFHPDALTVDPPAWSEWNDNMERLTTRNQAERANNEVLLAQQEAAALVAKQAEKAAKKAKRAADRAARDAAKGSGV